MKILNFNLSVILLFIFIYTYPENIKVESENEFVLPIKKEKSLSSARLKESIIKTFGDILQADLHLDELSIDLRKFTLNQTESSIKDENIYLSNANKNQLKDTLQDLKQIEDELNTEVNSLKKKLSKLKKKFNIN